VYNTPTTGSGPAKITVGQDGALWFTENNVGYIGRINPADVVNGTDDGITEYYPAATGTQPVGIASADGLIWFAENAGAIGSLNPAQAVAGTSDGFEQYQVPSQEGGGTADCQNMTVLNGDVWFTEQAANKIAVLVPSQVEPGTDDGITEYSIPTSGSEPNGIVAGPDGRIWFTEYGAGKIGAFNPGTDSFTEYPLHGVNGATGGGIGVRNITVGPDGNLWFTEFGDGGYGKITTGGAITEYALSSSTTTGPRGIVGGPTGTVWLTEYNTNSVDEISTATGAVLNHYGTLNGSSNGGARSIDVGPPGNDQLWVTEYNGAAIASIQLSAAATPTGTPGLGGTGLGAEPTGAGTFPVLPLVLIPLAAVLAILVPAGVLRRRRVDGRPDHLTP
jgi:streptogramin lyase